MHRQLIQGFVFFLVLIYCNLAYGQSITVGPDGKFKKQVISVPYAFYNASFGFAGAYAYAVTGWPQKQSALISTAMVSTKGRPWDLLWEEIFKCLSPKGCFWMPLFRRAISKRPTFT